MHGHRAFEGFEGGDFSAAFESIDKASDQRRDAMDQLRGGVGILKNTGDNNHLIKTGIRIDPTRAEAIDHQDRL